MLMIKKEEKKREKKKEEKKKKNKRRKWKNMMGKNRNRSLGREDGYVCMEEDL